MVPIVCKITSFDVTPVDNFPDTLTRKFFDLTILILKRPLSDWGLIFILVYGFSYRMSETMLEQFQNF